jgi:hypothetical protein
MPSSTKKKPQDRKPATSNYGSSWKTPLHDLELPSGEICQVKRPGVQGLIKAGVLHSLDTLTSIVQTETIPRAEGKPVPKEKDIESIVNDPEKFSTMMETVDKIVLHVVTQPKLVTNLVNVWEVEPVLADNGIVITAGIPKLDDNDKPVLRELEDDERDPDVVYVDYVDAMDKMYIMNFAVGGSANLTDFREKTSASVGSVPAREAASPEA